MGGYSGVNFGHLKSEVFRNGGYSRVNFGHLKAEVFQNGGGAFWSEIPERGFLENLDKNLLFSQKPACASQIVSHVLCMWRLKSYAGVFQNQAQIWGWGFTALFTEWLASGWNDPQRSFQPLAPFTAYGSFRNCTRQNHGTAGNCEASGFVNSAVKNHCAHILKGPLDQFCDITLINSIG